MARDKSRLIHHYDWRLRPSPNKELTVEAKFYPNELYRLLKPRIDCKESVYLVADGEAGFRIVASQLNDTGGYLALLIQHSDTRQPDPHLINVHTWKARRIRKEQGDGVGACCHVVIALEETEADSQTFRMVIENIRGISRSTIERLLNSEFKTVCKHQYHYENSRGQQKDLRPIGQLYGLPSDELVQGIIDGHLESVILVSQASVEAWDEANYIKDGENVLRLSIDRTVRGQHALVNFGNIFSKAKRDEIAAMRLVFRENGKAQNVEINLDADTIEDTLFNKVSVVEVDTPLDSYAETIRVDLMVNMVELLRQ